MTDVDGSPVISTDGVVGAGAVSRLLVHLDGHGVAGYKRFVIRRTVLYCTQ